MLKFPVTKFSVVSLVLSFVSILAATFIPNLPGNGSRQLFYDSLTNDSGWGGINISSVTCAPDSLYGNIQNYCHASTAAAQGNSETTELEDLTGFDDSTSNSSFPADGGIGGNNTSDNS